MRGRRGREVVLAIQPSPRGFAFALFESPLSPVDWGLKEFRGKGKHARSLEAVKCLVEQHQPDVLVLKAPRALANQKTHHSWRLYRLIRGFAESQLIELRTYRREEIRACFSSSGAVTRDEIAQAIAGQVPAFACRLPRKRKLWVAEDPHMKLFDAVSLIMTFYCNHRDDRARRRT